MSNTTLVIDTNLLQTISICVQLYSIFKIAFSDENSCLSSAMENNIFVHNKHHNFMSNAKDKENDNFHHSNEALKHYNTLIA